MESSKNNAPSIEIDNEGNIKQLRTYSKDKLKSIVKFNSNGKFRSFGRYNDLEPAKDIDMGGDYFINVWNNGHPKILRYTDNGKFIIKGWYSTGQPSSYATGKVDGMLGLSKTFYQSGNLQYHTIFDNEGSILWSKSYHDQYVHGAQVLKSHITYENGKIKREKRYDDKTRTHITVEYKDGKKHGTFYVIVGTDHMEITRGIITVQGSYSDGKKNGIWTYTRILPDEGHVITEKCYVNGKKHGLFSKKIIHAGYDTKFIYIRRFVNNKPVGMHVFNKIINGDVFVKTTLDFTGDSLVINKFNN